MEAVSWVGVRTDRPEPMVELLSDVMGIPVTGRRPDVVVHTLPGGEHVEIFGPGDVEHQHFTTGPVPGFRVPDVGSASDRIASLGGELIGAATQLEDGSGWQHFRAPDGYLYEVVSGSFPPGPSSDGGVGVRRLRWLGTATDEFEAMTSFLSKLLGSAPSFEEPGMKAFELAGGTVFEVFGPGHHDHAFYGAEARGPIVGFLVDDLADAWERLASGGAEKLGSIEGTPEVEWAHVRLPDGNLYEITSPRASIAH